MRRRRAAGGAGPQPCSVAFSALHMVRQGDQRRGRHRVLLLRHGRGGAGGAEPHLADAGLRGKKQVLAQLAADKRRPGDPVRRCAGPASRSACQLRPGSARFSRSASAAAQRGGSGPSSRRGACRARERDQQAASREAGATPLAAPAAASPSWRQPPRNWWGSRAGHRCGRPSASRHGSRPVPRVP